ncbi:RNA 2',3'-cyclic phosphodiesterase [uncultured Porticoccus sp.]|uniref:RNA 2',3'-cyclic phosphodiesterase n=1 Tax=uncultured Porticoccus sp. TaxID=1256050 RepID=UPI0030DDC0B1
MRLFIALTLTETVNQLLDDICQQRLNDTNSSQVPAQRRHLTLRFLGEQTAEQAAIAVQIVQALRVKKFDLSLKAVEQFPARESRTVAAIPEYSTSLMALYQQLSASLAAGGFESVQRGFRPHITLGKAARTSVTKIDLEIDICLPVRHIVLFQSQLTASGPLYSPLATVNLR